MVKILTDVLDVIGVLLLAAGAAYAAYPFLGMACLAVAGVVILLGSGLAARVNQPKGPNK